MDLGLGDANERKLQRMFSAQGGDLVIGLAGDAQSNNGQPVPGSLRVAITRNDILIMLSPDEARKMADKFSRALKRNGFNDLAWIPQTLREVASEIDEKRSGHN